MPQMAPLWWEMLFILFIYMYFMINIMIYFIKKSEMKTNMKFNKSLKQLNWMW
uniref:ATP synthase F0 subunit 8 n=1 Tax=Menida musiva TaxID=1873848 RepID=UPI0023D85919|nr:ATP synthase F0 subunit 8 [Menida musiva]WDD39668.1 ATP synthase F0 subunit 8 [Menida musiva]